MNKLEYIARQFSRAHIKKYEHYVITRIWNLLNDIDLKFITQQYVTRPEGRALTDMYFPQLKIHIEVDEKFHRDELQRKIDSQRQIDIINATNHIVLRIQVEDVSIEEVNSQIDKVISILKAEKIKIKDFKPWNIEEDQSSEKYITKGNINIDDDCAFKSIVDAVNCFGVNYKGVQRGGIKHPREVNTLLWFPKLYENALWKNSITNDERVIREISKLINNKAEAHINKVLNSKIHSRIVFARVKSPLGDVMYRFKGKYQLNKEETNLKNGLIWERISKSVKTYPKPLVI